MTYLQKLIKGLVNDKIKTTSLPAILEGIVNEVAAETGLTTAVISNIVSSQFRLVDEVIRANSLQDDFEEYKSIRLQYLGMWKPSIYKYRKYRRICKVDEPIIKENTNGE